MNEPFTKEEVFSEGSETVYYKVRGFWAFDMLRCSRHRRYSTGKWHGPEISWSTGGRDPKGEPSNIVAAENFAKAILDAVEVVKKWEAEGSV